MEEKDFGKAFAEFVLEGAPVTITMSPERLRMVADIMQMTPAMLETWMRVTEEGKAWLAKNAAEVGVPLQLALPFDAAKGGKVQ